MNDVVFINEFVKPVVQKRKVIIGTPDNDKSFLIQMIQLFFRQNHGNVFFSKDCYSKKGTDGECRKKGES